MTARPYIRALPAALLIAAGAAACGGYSSAGGNGLQGKSADAIFHATLAAAESAKSVHVSGSMVQGGSGVGLDLTMVAGVGASGWISEDSKKFNLILDHNTVYISGTPSFWKAYGNAAVASLLKGRWLKSTTSGSFASVAKIGNLREFFQQVFADHNTLTKTATKTIGGVKVIGLHDSKKGGVMYVAISGRPYPIELSGGTGSASGRLRFSDYNAATTITPPKNSLSLAQLQKAG